MRLITALAFATAMSLTARAQDAPPATSAAPPPPPMSDELAKFIEATAPNEHHKKLEAYVGEWETVSRWWLEGPDQPPATSPGNAWFKMALDGRFVAQDFRGHFMGMPMRGIGYIGYDNLKKMYVMSWIDNTSTSLATATGGFDASGAVLTLTGTYDDPMTGEIGKAVRYDIRMNGKDQVVFEMFDAPPKGKAVRVGEIVYTRARKNE